MNEETKLKRRKAMLRAKRFRAQYPVGIRDVHFAGIDGREAYWGWSTEFHRRFHANYQRTMRSTWP